MAQGLPARCLNAGWLAWTFIASACTQQHQGPDSRPESRLDALGEVRAILARSLGPFEGKLAAAVVRIDRTSPREACRAAIDLPRRLRLEQRDGGPDPFTLLWRDDKSFVARGTGSATLASGADAGLATQWKSFLRAVTLEPLTTCKKATRQGPTVLALHLENGETWRLEHDPATKAPVRLSGPECDVAFLDFVESAVTRIPKTVASKELGERTIKIEDAAVLFDELVFDDLGTRVNALQKQPRAERTVGSERKPRKPQLQSVATDLVLVVADPGDWKARVATVWKEMKTLREQGQDSAGLPLFFAEDGQARIGIPFRPDAERGTPFTQRPQQIVLRRAAHQVAALHLDKSSLEDAVAKGTEVLEAFLRERGLRATGPIRAIPYVASFSSESESGQDYKKIEVRLEIPIE